MVIEVEKKYNQSVFVCSVPGSTLPKDHFVFTVKELIEDFKCEFPCMFEYEYNGCGRPKKYFEDELLGLVIYGGYNNKNSCRELSDWCLNNDESVMFITNNKFPSKTVIHRFISDNGLLLDAFFAYTVSYGVDKSLIDGDCVAVDGTYFKAYANNFRLIKIEEIEFLEDLIKTHGGNFSKNGIWFKLNKYYLKNSNDEEINDLITEINSICNKEAIKLLKIALNSLEKQDYILCLLNYLKSNYDGKHTISLTDPDSRWMMDKEGKTGLNYNYQVATDTKNGMIVAQYLTQNPTDHHELLPMAYEIINNLEFKPNVIIADNAYIQNTTLEFLYNNGILAIMPDRVQSTHSKAEFAKAQFEYDFDKDVYICPKGEILIRKNDRYQKDKLYKL